MIKVDSKSSFFSEPDIEVTLSSDNQELHLTNPPAPSLAVCGTTVEPVRYPSLKTCKTCWIFAEPEDGAYLVIGKNVFHLYRPGNRTVCGLQASGKPLLPGSYCKACHQQLFERYYRLDRTYGLEPGELVFPGFYFDEIGGLMMARSLHRYAAIHELGHAYATHTLDYPILVQVGGAGLKELSHNRTDDKERAALGVTTGNFSEANKPFIAAGAICAEQYAIERRWYKPGFVNTALLQQDDWWVIERFKSSEYPTGQDLVNQIYRILFSNNGFAEFVEKYGPVLMTQNRIFISPSYQRG